MKTNKELGEIGAKAAFETGNRVNWLMAVHNGMPGMQIGFSAWNGDEPARTAFAAAVADEVRKNTVPLAEYESQLGRHVEMMERVRKENETLRAELTKTQWRSVKEQPTRNEADSNGNVTALDKFGVTWAWHWNIAFHGNHAFWRAYTPPPAPTAEQEMEAAYQASLKDTWMDVKQWNSKEAFAKGWQAARASKEAQS